MSHAENSEQQPNMLKKIEDDLQAIKELNQLIEKFKIENDKELMEEIEKIKQIDLNELEIPNEDLLPNIDELKMIQSYVSETIDDMAKKWLLIATDMPFQKEDGSKALCNGIMFGIDDEKELVELLRWALKQEVFTNSLQTAMALEVEAEQKKIIVPGLKIEKK